MSWLKLRPHLIKIISVSFRFLRLSRKRLTINATTHIFLEISRQDLSINVWVVVLIVNRLRDKRKNTKKKQLAVDLVYGQLYFSKTCLHFLKLHSKIRENRIEK